VIVAILIPANCGNVLRQRLWRLACLVVVLRTHGVLAEVVVSLRLPQSGQRGSAGWRPVRKRISRFSLASGQIRARVLAGRGVGVRGRTHLVKRRWMNCRIAPGRGGCRGACPEDIHGGAGLGRGRPGGGACSRRDHGSARFWPCRTPRSGQMCMLALPWTGWPRRLTHPANCSPVARVAVRHHVAHRSPADPPAERASEAAAYASIHRPSRVFVGVSTRKVPAGATAADEFGASAYHPCVGEARHLPASDR
jgi:hypothetical protein